jgi:hypothetical protein
MNVIEAINKLRQDDTLSEEIQMAIRSLIAWQSVIDDLQNKIEFARMANAKDYAIGMDTALFVIREHLKETNIIE